MAYELTWDTTYNVDPTSETDLTAQCRSYMMQLKDYLIATAGWVMHESCDSVAVGGAGVDKWDSLTDIVAATGAHSWVVLKSPEGFCAGADGTYTGDQSRLWFCINMRYANYYQVEFTLHYVAPTGGTTTAAPTSTTQLTFPSQQFNGSILNTNTYFHFASTDEGGFLTMVTESGSGHVPFGLMLMNLVDPTEVNSTTFDYPYAVLATCVYSVSGVGAFSTANLVSTTYSKVFGYDGTACVAKLNSLAGGVSWLGSGWGATGDNINGEHKNAQVWITCETAGRYGVVGRLADMFGSGMASPQGLVDHPTLPTKVFVGNLYLPTDVVVLNM
jgi:hypothetical protein